MAQPSTTIVSVTYNARKTIGPLLDAIKPAHDSGEVVVVVADNASADGTEAFVREQYPWVTFTQNGGNIGFASGCNAGFAKVETKYVMFLNPDTVMDPEALSVMLKFMESHPRCGLAGPAMIYPGGGLQAAGMLLTPSGVLKAAAGLGLGAFPLRREIEPNAPAFRTEWVCGACMLLPTAVYRDVGMMDSRFFLYFEETDLCRKIVAQGHEIWAVGEAVIEHEGGASAKDTGRKLSEGCIAEFFFASRYYYMTKNYGRGPAVASEIGELALLAGRTVVDRLRRRDRNLLKERLEGPVLRPPKPR